PTVVDRARTVRAVSIPLSSRRAWSPLARSKDVAFAAAAAVVAVAVAANAREKAAARTGRKRRRNAVQAQRRSPRNSAPTGSAGKIGTRTEAARGDFSRAERGISE